MTWTTKGENREREDSACKPTRSKAQDINEWEIERLGIQLQISPISLGVRSLA